MIVTFVHIWVKENHIEDFKKASIANHKESIKEPGNLRFDVLQDDTDPSKFVLYEAYESEEASAEHKKTRPGLPWPGFLWSSGCYAPSCAQRGKADSSSSDQSGTPSG